VRTILAHRGRCSPSLPNPAPRALMALAVPCSPDPTARSLTAAPLPRRSMMTSAHGRWPGRRVWVPHCLPREAGVAGGGGEGARGRCSRHGGGDVNVSHARRQVHGLGGGDVGTMTPKKIPGLGSQVADRGAGCEVLEVKLGGRHGASVAAGCARRSRGRSCCGRMK
jgi:hypothetical protein